METPRKKIHRFFVPFEHGTQQSTIEDPELLHQMTTVLRFRPGEQIMLVHEGHEALGMITRMEKTSIQLKLVSENTVKAEPKAKLTAYISMFKKEPFEWMLEKLTEVGVSIIIPIETERTIRFPWKPERFRAILKESAEQCGRGIIPELHEAMSLEAALKHAANKDLKVIFEPGHAKTPATQVGSIAMFIGPEGGWSPNELKLATSSGIATHGLGNLVLRAETAAIIGAYELLKESL